MTQKNQITFVAIDPKTGLHLRPASESEISQFLKIDVLRPIARRGDNVTVGSVSIYEYTGPGGNTRIIGE